MNTHDLQTMRNVEESHRWFRGKREIVHEFIKNNVGSVLGKNILDFGCGTGFFSLPLQDQGANIVCADASPKALEFVRQKGIKRAVLTDAGRLDFPENSFDLILVLDVLEHIEDDKVTAREIFRVLKSNGVLIATVPAFNILYGPQDKRIGHFRRYSKKNFEQLLQEFRVERSSFYNFFLFAPIFFVRLIFRYGSSNHEAKDELVINNRVLNFVFYKFLRLEKFLLRFINLPFGVSLIIVARKKV